MTINFQPDVVLPKDPAGFGRWLTGHYYEHLVLAKAAAALSTPVIVPNYDILAWRDEPEFVTNWLVNHEAMHAQLRVGANLTGIDFSLVDFSNDDEFSEWIDDHSQEHIDLRRIYGIT